MKIIFGLGNPGLKYKYNRHNVGYMVVDELGKSKKLHFKRSFKLNALMGEMQVGEDKVFLVKPRTFMNNSGGCVQRVLNNYRVTMNNVLIVYDDVDLPLGKIRFKKKGSSAGHRGLSSVIESLGDDGINRLRLGIGRLKEKNLCDYVLSDFSCDEKVILDETISLAISACLDWVNFGNEYVMRNYNKRS